MKILIIGATGGTGRKIVELSLAQGHEVTAFARAPEKLQIQHGKLTVARGDVMNYSQVEDAIRGADAVVSALGAPALTRTMVRSVGTKNIVDSMEKCGVRRLLSVSSMGIGDSKDMLPFHYKYLLVPLLLKQGFAEHEIQEKHVRNSRLDWTLVRPGELTNGNATGVYRHGLPVQDKTIKARISRADVAHFILGQLHAEAYLRKAPWVSY